MEGIYKLTNLINGKTYIGQSFDLEKRKNKFFRFGTKHYAGEAINNARQKYNNKDFWKYEILEYCNENNINEKEQQYIQQYKSNKKKYGYNITSGGQEGYNFSHTEETKEKIRQYMLKNCPWKGKERTKEHIENLKKSLKGRKNIWNEGKHWDEDFKKRDSERMKKLWDDPEYRKRQSESHKGKPNIHSMKKAQYEDKEFNSINELIKFLGISKATYRRRLKKGLLNITYK